MANILKGIETAAPYAKHGLDALADLIRGFKKKPSNLEKLPAKVKIKPAVKKSVVSQETLDNPFFGSYYKHPKVDYEDASKRSWLTTFDKPKKDLIHPQLRILSDAEVKAREIKLSAELAYNRKIAQLKNDYVSQRMAKIEQEHGGEAIPGDFPNFQKFMMSLDDEARAITLDYDTLDVPQITGNIPQYTKYIKPKKGSDSKYTSSTFHDEYMNKVFTLYKDKIPDLEAGHELMRNRRIALLEATGDERFLEQVKYPVFFTNVTRNRAHIRLENNLIKLRDRRKELTANRQLRNKFQDEISQIGRTISNIKHDMEALGVESRIFDETSKKFKKFGNGFSSPMQLHKSLQEEQALKFLGSKDDPYNVAEKYLVKEGDNVFLPIGLKDGGFASIEEVIGYNNGG